MAARKTFPDRVVNAIRESKILGIKAGHAPHRFIGIWVVVVGRRVFVRSWSRHPRSWWRTFQDDPTGRMSVGTLELPIRAVRIRGEKTLAAVDRAYAEKYDTPGSLRYVRGFRRPTRRATTTELVPR